MLHRIRHLWNKKITDRRRKNIFIVGVFITCCLGIAFGIAQYIERYYHEAARHASVAYSDLMEYRQDNEKRSEVIAKSLYLIHHYPKTIYADMTRLMLAEEAYQSGHLSDAQNYLKEILNNRKKEPLTHMARLRLARLMAEDQQYTEALAVLAVSSAGGFESLYETAKGDIYMAMQSLDKANEAYKLAIQSMPEGASDIWLQIKQADIGGQG
jgi:predicted negative regulator of RcsB-dependent stress response